MAFSHNTVGPVPPGFTTITLTFPFLDRAHVKVSVDKVDLPGTAWVWNSDSQIELNDGLVGGETAKVYRTTPAQGVQADFKPGAFDYEELNKSLLHLLYIVQEAYDNASVAVEAGNNAFSYLVQIEDLVDDATILFGDMQALATAFGSQADSSLVALTAARTDALNSIASGLSSALSAISTDETAALSTIAASLASALSTLAAARDATVALIDPKVTLATNAAATATNKASEASASAAAALVSEQNVALASVPVGAIIMRFGPLQPGFLAWGEGGTFDRATYPHLATWLDANGASLGLTTPQIAAGTIPDWRDYSPRTAGGSLGPVVGAKQGDAVKTLSVPMRAYAGVSAGAGAASFYTPDTATNAPITVTGEAETRVKSFGVRWQIKAFGALVDNGTVVLSALAASVQNLESRAIRDDVDQSAQSKLAVNKINILKNTLQAWELIGAPIRLTSTAATIDWTGLGAFRELRLAFFGAPTSNGSIGCRVGAGSFDSTSTYGYQYIGATSGTVAGSAGGTTMALLSPYTINTGIDNAGLSSITHIHAFNQAIWTRFISTGGGRSGTIHMSTTLAEHQVSLACNQVQLVPVAGQFSTGSIAILEGIRG